MRRVLALVLGLVALLALVAPDASAQAPTSKVTINGLVDNISSYTRNMSNIDLNYNDKRDKEWYARTRVRPDITGEVGTTKFVLGLEIDAVWGQTGSADSTLLGGTPQRAGATAGALDLNTDLLGPIELKWAYTEFDFPGLPFASRVRLGAQPWGTAATYKLAALANGDFAGVHLNIKPVPEIALLLTYAQAEEDSTGRQDGFLRGEDFALIASIELTPVKGIDIKPVWAWFHAEGTTNGAARQGRGGLGTGAGVYPLNATEDRHTVGLDARVRLGPISIDPTVLFQWGERDIVSLSGSLEEQKRRAWLVDLRAGFQAGPLLLEAAGIYTTGNAANSDVRNASTKVRYFEPISTDTSYYATWAEHWALGIDYFNIIHNAAGGLNPGVAIGYDKYGLIRVGTRASYAVTPAFTVRAAVTANWTEEKVDTSGVKTVAAGLTPGDFRGDERYLGTELDLGFQWRFAPGITFDMVGAYTWAGNALNAARAVNANTGESRVHGDSKDILTASARLRFNF